ncbi:MAG: hypothetical protein AAF264_08140 [Pseudomonadota bacterium]
MPNTLAHLGVQALVGRVVVPSVSMGWVWLGCVLPDLPWIGLRAMGMVVSEASAFDLRLWAIGQSSLFFCAIGSAGFAFMSRRPGPVFGVLVLGCLLHLLLNASQTKWANGVVLAAPLDWSTINAELYWPEDWPTSVLTISGGMVFVWAALFWRSTDAENGRRRPALAMLLFSGWLVGPIAALDAIEADGAHHVNVLREADARDGRAIGFDRARLIPTETGRALEIWTGEVLAIEGAPAMRGERTVSVRGRFAGTRTVVAEDMHVHTTGWRDLMSYVGLLLVASCWGVAILRR